MFAVSLLVALVAADGPITLESVLAHVRSGPAELRAEVDLAQARRAVAEAALRLREAPIVGVEAGPRWDERSTTVDLSLGVELALLRRGDQRDELERALAASERALRRAALAATRRIVHDAYIDAWAAAERVRLRGRDRDLVERWLDLARRRVEAGAEAAFEADIVKAQLEDSRRALAQARADAVGSWHRLEAWAALTASPNALTEPPRFLAYPRPAAAPEDGAASEAIRARTRLLVSLAGLGAARDRSRFSVLSSVEREGEENAAHVGFALRWPRRGEHSAIAATVVAEVAALEREAELEMADLRVRWLEASTLLEELGDPATIGESAAGLETALVALDVRLAEGKDRPVEALAARREILSLLEDALERRVAAHHAAAELIELTTEVMP
jgi:hypothetical protein